VRREALYDLVVAYALGWGMGVVPPQVIDSDGIVAATRSAMAAAIEALPALPDYLLVDYLTLPDLSYPQHSLPKGDARVLSIAAASILAKVTRDRIMVFLDSRYPGYGFAQHKGYGTAMHRAALSNLGASQVHRHSFAPIQKLRTTETPPD
jgi:ribonuclease HII